MAASSSEAVDAPTKNTSTDDDQRALTTSLQTRLTFVNHAELPVLAAAFASKKGQLLVVDHREMRLYAGSQQVRRAPLPSTSHGSVVAAIHYNPHGENFVLVYASSSSVYGANTNMPFSVADNVDHPVSH